ncbi:hypothetical protein J2Z40_003527 [Cytobacillus eiseniae]|uniref:Apea-like HEPN domain-containing protein n=1 Tax=Cytobacillus eiseniae TaxID=762947 RepID=A0ABS4RJ58_9BACI|nr:hypothetical protein [Cytobacillus eiseniae]MBP2242945.1 hypothetical protein [Cytobacillus eiseniae]
MYKHFKNQGYNPNLNSHQIYFIQRWGELLENTHIHYRKLLKPSLRSVLKEALRVIDHFKDQVLYEHNIFEILEEVIETLNNNIVLKKIYPNDFNLIESRIKNFLSNKQTFMELKSELDKYKHLNLPYTLMTTLYNKLENEDIPKLYANYLKDELNKPTLSFETVDGLIELVISELIYEGHNKQYLFNWGNGVFIIDSEPNFLKRVERISELGKKNRRPFDCFITLKLPEGYDSLFNHKEGNITFHKDPETLRVEFIEEYSLEEPYHKQLYEFFQTDKHISRIKLESTDEVAAINSAREELISTTKLFTLENKHKQYYPGNLSEAIVYDFQGNQINMDPYIETYQQGLQISNNEKYIKINLSSKMNNKYQGLDQLLQWCRVIQDSPRETGLVAMWSLLEYLFVTDSFNKRKNVLDYAIPYICHFYLKSLAWRTRDILKNNNSENLTLMEEVKNILGEKAIDNLKKEVKLPYFIEFLATNKQKALDIYSDKVIEQRYIGLINRYLSLRGKKLWFEKYLETLKEQVHSDFLRAYRMRNILAHQASMDEEFLDEIYDVIAFYLKLIIDDLLYTITLQPNNSVHDLVKVKRESYEDYLEELKNLDKVEDVNFKKLITTKSLLV